MKAVIVPSSRAIELFGDPCADAFVLGRSLRANLELAIRGAGLELAAVPPSSEAYLAISDRTFATASALARFIAQAKAPARLRVENRAFLELTGPLQKLDAPGVYELALVPAGTAAVPAFSALPPVTIDLRIKEIPPPKDFVPFFEHMPSAVPMTSAVVHQIDHWTHVLRANWLALAAMWIERGERFREKTRLTRLFRFLRLLARARSIDRSRIAAALTTRGKRTRVHHTAVVEASVLGDEVEIGPFAVVRGAVIGDGAKIGAHAMVTYSVLGDRVRVGNRGTANLCVAYPGASFGAGNGYQATLFGRDAFLAWSSTVFDLSFGDPVKVTDGGERVSSGMWFLGACIGHRARVGGLVVLGYGAEVPNGAVIVAPIEETMRGFEPGEGPHRVTNGVARPIRGG